MEKSKIINILNALSNVNQFYLIKKTYFQFRDVWYYDMKNLNDKKLINSNSYDQRNKFDIFNSLIFATNSQHALNLIIVSFIGIKNIKILNQYIMTEI